MTAPAIAPAVMSSRWGRSIAKGANTCRRAGPVRATRTSVVAKSTEHATSRDPIKTRAPRATRLAARATRGEVDAISDTTNACEAPAVKPKTSVPIQKQVWASLLGSSFDAPGPNADANGFVSNATRTPVTAFDPDEFIRKLDKEFLGGGADDGADLGTQGDAVTKGNRAAVLERALDPDGGAGDLDYLQELIAIQAGGPKNVGFFGTRNMGFLHQQLVEILSYALVLTENHIFTSGATGTNAAVIRGALRAERPDLLTVILPQSVSKQPEESRELLKKVENVVELKFDALPLGEASRKCNDNILAKVQQVICFAFHDSNLLLDTCHEAKMQRKLVALFYLD